MLTSQPPIGWLKLSLSLNIWYRLVALLVSQLFILELPPLLKAKAPLNISVKSATPLVSKDPMFWSKASAPSNIDRISVALDVSHKSNGWLYKEQLKNKFLKLAIPLTSQLFILELNRLQLAKVPNNPAAPDRSGTSVADRIIFVQPEKATKKSVHTPVPQFFIFINFCPSPPLKSIWPALSVTFMS